MTITWLGSEGDYTLGQMINAVHGGATDQPAAGCPRVIAEWAILTASKEDMDVIRDCMISKLYAILVSSVQGVEYLSANSVMDDEGSVVHCCPLSF